VHSGGSAELLLWRPWRNPAMTLAESGHPDETPVPIKVRFSEIEGRRE
jgi:hypothetical protein